MLKESVFDGFRSAVIEENLHVYGIHVYQENQGSVEHRFRSNERVHLFSGSKSFVSMAVGIAAGEGRLSLNDKAIDFFPAAKPGASPGAEDITIRDLLQMRAGHAESLFTTDSISNKYNRDLADLFFITPMIAKAGASYKYDNGCTYILSRIIEEVGGVTLREYLIPRLFENLAIYNPQWLTCNFGHSLGAIGLLLTTEEFSRLGILMLQHGVWEDKQLVPSSYLREAVHDIVEVEGFSDIENHQGYGYQLWRCTIPGAYRADGKYGQYSVVLPGINAVVTVTAHNEHNAYNILRAVWREVLPRIE
jgi:CubicO group peptidase (beta-lactamase class C family)